MKEEITIGKVTMYAETIPTNLVFDESYLTRKDRFTILEIDGSYLVITELMDNSIRGYKVFLRKEDAFSYLELFGVERE